MDIDKIKKKIKKTLKSYNVVKAGIFGSYARGDQKPTSDIDILIKINDPKMSLIGLIKLEKELKNILKKEVDLIEYCSLNPMLKKDILREEKRII
jgi:uncharacterized protein